MNAITGILADYGGGWGIRTPDPVSQIPPFQGGALDHYANPPCGLFIPRTLGFEELLYGTHDFLFLLWIEPDDVFVAFEPRHLTLGVFGDLAFK